MLTTGSLFSGYLGLDMATQMALGPMRLAWVCDNAPGAARILAHRADGVPNLGDVTTVDWSQVEPVDVLTGGFPCQDLSTAGLRRGLMPGTRSGLWTHMATAISQLRPRLVVAENVRGILHARAHSLVEPCPLCVGDGDGVALRALGAVLGDLADLGYDAAWHGIPASDVGAAHARFRVFVLAWPAADPDSAARDAGRLAATGGTPGGRAQLHAGRRGRASAADPEGLRSDRGRGPEGTRRPEPADSRDAAADPDRAGREGQGRAASSGREGPAGDAAAHPDRAEQSREPGERARRAFAGRSGRAASDSPDERRDARGTGSARHVRRPDAAERGSDVAALPDSRGLAGRAELHGRAYDVGGRPRGGHPHRCGVAATDTDGRPVRLEPQPDDGCDQATVAGGDGADGHLAAWGKYARAVRRWEHITGRPAPAPVEPGRLTMGALRWHAHAHGNVDGYTTHAMLRAGRWGARLSPAFVEWLMGLPEQWVTGVPGLTRNEALSALGGGVVPQQGAAAITALWPIAAESGATI